MTSQPFITDQDAFRAMFKQTLYEAIYELMATGAETDLELYRGLAPYLKRARRLLGWLEMLCQPPEPRKGKR